ncbi:uncharacterized protein VICG_00426 [Vittaforma corneae ATCC 50505]|uniref:Uncharacterized protein n=1 Tax=Vittaforma corneae (strain ATCC 50505) TaxID=993615 RepID=L2GQ00_VITCO|nr:uncharacterized protein VICG_00426 [Vittaforma corneae ATCC 50505]ELA42674.1 hypothetical protein VICG_00426 [Vittaforma corneae ATCC 50505]
MGCLLYTQILKPQGFRNINLVCRTTAMVKTMFKNLIAKCFSCCGDYQVQRKRYSLDDVKIDSEVSDIVTSEKQPKMKKTQPDKLNIKGQVFDGKNTMLETKSRLSSKTMHQQSKNKEDIEKKSELSSKTKAGTGLYQKSKIETEPKFLSSGMVKMAILKRNKSSERVKMGFYKCDQKINIQHDRCNGKNNLESKNIHRNDAKDNTLAEDIKPKDLFNRRHAYKSQNTEQTNVKDIVSVYREQSERYKEEKASNVETFKPSSDQVGMHIDQSNTNSASHRLCDKIAGKEYNKLVGEELLNTQYGDTYKVDSQQTLTEKNVGVFRNEKSIEEYLLEVSLESESRNTESETDVSCSIDFYDKKEFSKILLKTIKHYLKETQISTMKKSKRKG